MLYADYITKEDIKQHNPKWPEIPNHPYRILIVGRSWSGKTNAFSNLINNEPDTDKTYLCVKDPCKAKCQLIIQITESTSLKKLN